MLFAVVGGEFFSSASGYSKCLTLLLLGQKNEEKPMRVSPLNQYQLVDQESNPDIQLASGKSQPVRGCASLECFGCAAAGLESSSPLKVGPTQNQEVLPGPPLVFDESKKPKNLDGCAAVDGDDSKRNIFSLKSSLKKGTNSAPIASNGSGGDGGKNNEHDTLCENNNGAACQMERKVQWTDTIGGELFEIREFEMSEDGSDGDFDHTSEKTCSCSIM